MITIYHIYPEDDSSKHKMGEKCKCNPDVRCTEDGTSVYVIHKEFAGKELVAEAKKILNRRVA